MTTTAVSEYETKTDALLAGMGVSFKATYLDHALHFEEDTEARDIYRCIFRRGAKRFHVRFGQSLDKSREGEPPSSYDVVACLTKDDPGTFEQFCDEYGYDTDSRKMFRLYSRVVREWYKVRSFFSDGELDRLREIW